MVEDPLKSEFSVYILSFHLLPGFGNGRDPSCLLLGDPTVRIQYNVSPALRLLDKAFSLCLSSLLQTNHLNLAVNFYLIKSGTIRQTIPYPVFVESHVYWQPSPYSLTIRVSTLCISRGNQQLISHHSRGHLCPEKQ